jgi:hypothetical protein
MLLHPVWRLEIIVPLNLGAPAFTVITFPKLLSVGIVQDMARVRVDIQNGLGPVGDVSQVAPKGAFLTFGDFLIEGDAVTDRVA